MPDEADRIADAIRASLRVGMERSPELRALIVAVAEWVVANKPQPDPESPDSMGGIAEAGSETSEEEPAGSPLPIGVVPLSLGDTRIDVAVPGAPEELISAIESADAMAADERPARPEIDLRSSALRCGLKAEACRLCVERAEAGDDEARDPEFRARVDDLLRRRVQLDNAFLWMLIPERPQPDADAMRQIASCYEAHRAACEVAAASNTTTSGYSTQEMESAYQLLAEANSALRVAIDGTWLTQPDRDQDDAHHWLRERTFTQHIYVPRFMKLDDPADPRRAGTLLGEIRALAERVTEREQNGRRIDSSLNTLRYHARKQGGDGRFEPHDAKRINESADTLLSLGIDPGDARLIQLKHLVNLDAFPNNEPPCEALRRIAAGWIDREADAPAPADSEPKWSERVLDVRRRLRGGRIVIVGGTDQYPDQRRRIEEAFEPAALEWAELSEHGSGARMRPLIARDDTRLVLLLVPLAGHLHSEEARAEAKKRNVPCVLVRAGYHPEQLAVQILEQAGDRLGE